MNNRRAILPAVSDPPEIALPSGHLSLGVVRVGETVRRPAKASSAFVDFDMAAPGSVLEDIGYLAWSWCVASKPERKSVSVQAAQVRLVADSYGLDSVARAGLFDALLERQRRNTRFWNEQLSLGQAIASTPDKVRELIAWSEREFAFTSVNRAHFEAALL